MKLLYLDFEFNGVAEKSLNLVSVAALGTDGGKETYKRFFWLYENSNRKSAQAFFTEMIRQGYIFVAYVMEAESRSMNALFKGSPPKFSAIDLFLEYRCLLNHNNSLAYGLQYIKGAVVKTSPKKSKWEVREDDTGEHHKPGDSLASAVYKLLGEKIDAKEKDEVRNIIIASNRDLINQARERIEKYNLSDIYYLPRLLNAVSENFSRKGWAVKKWLGEAKSRGAYAIATAKMIDTGYPVNISKVNSLIKSVPDILSASAKECVELTKDFEPFRFCPQKKKFIANEAGIRDWIKNQPGHKTWEMTPGGKPKISREAFDRYYSSESEGFSGAFIRYLSTKKSMNGFLPGGKGKKFREFIGSDNRVRPYFNIYGAQSSRSQPGASGYIWLKSKWMRNLLEAKPGRALAQADYTAEEWLVAAVMSQDEKMMEAYATGDVYLAFAKSAGLAPPEANKDTHKPIRDLCKALVLGMSYEMTETGLAARLTALSDRVCTVPEARKFIDLFYGIYAKYGDYKKRIWENYSQEKRLVLSDGWTMWGDNKNKRSVGNVPIQGESAVIMRTAVKLCQARGLDVVGTLHDSLIIEFDSYDDKAVILLMDCMTEAFEIEMKRYGKTIPVKLEGDRWSLDYGTKMPKEIPYVETVVEYVDSRAKKDFEKYRPYLTPQSTKELHHGISNPPSICPVSRQESARVAEIHF